MKAIIEGNTNKARSVIIELEQANPTDAEIWFTIAEFYGLLADEVGSARTLEKGVDRGYFNYPFMLSNSFFDSVRSSSEFQRVLARAKAKHETLRTKFPSDKYSTRLMISRGITKCYPNRWAPWTANRSYILGGML